MWYLYLTLLMAALSLIALAMVLLIMWAMEQVHPSDH